VVLLLTAFVTPTIFQFAGRAVRSNRNDVTDWLPKNYEETRQLDWFRSYFVSDQFVIISWEGCEIGNDPSGSGDDVRIGRLDQALQEARLPLRDGTPGVRCFKTVRTAREALDEMTTEPIGLSYETAVQRLTGTMIGADGRRTCVLATLADESIPYMRQVLERPNERRITLRNRDLSPLFVALSEAGVSAADVRLGGPPIVNVAIDEEGERTLLVLVMLSGTLGIGLAWWSLGSLRMTAIVFICGVLSAATALAVVALSGAAMDAVLMSMPALVYVLAVSGAIHYVNYYRQAVAESGFQRATAIATAHAWKPALLCSITTAIGLFSLCTSDLAPIKKFGAYTGVGVIVTLPVLFGILPATLRLWPWRNVLRSTSRNQGRASRWSMGLARWWDWDRFGHFVQRRHAAVLLGSVGLIAVLCLGLPRVKTSIDLMELFGHDAVVLRDYHWLESHLGRLVPMELAVRFPRHSLLEHWMQDEGTPQELVKTYSFLERLEFVTRVEQSILRKLGHDGLDLVGASMSAASFAESPGDPRVGFAGWSARYVRNRELARHRTAFEKSGYLRTDERTGEELWRISVRLTAFHDVDPGDLVQLLHDAAEPVFAARNTCVATAESLVGRDGELPKGARVLLCSPEGLTPEDHDLAALLAGKRIMAVGFEESLASATQETLAKLKEFDGVVPGSNFNADEAAKATQMGLPLLSQRAEARPHVPSDGSEVGIVYSGVVPIVYKAQRALLDGLIQSTWWSFASITPLMMFVCRGLVAGTIVMLPNILPVLVVFGGMGWLGIPVDIGSMMSASIALGVAVDDTIHFLAWFRQDLAQLGNRDAAVIAAYRRSATPALQVALVNGLGLSVFAISSFTPTQRFGCLMLAILGAGVVAELIMLPALLFSPLGRVFGRRADRPVQSGAARSPNIKDELARVQRPA
jgi:predicted RND superfamily exporter protein